jgi:Ca2+-binding EF-hand superfamily protein
LSRRKSVCGIGAAVALLLAGMPPALAQSAPKPAQDAMLANGPPIWDTNHDGVYTCDEWKKYADRLFTSADRNHDGNLDKSEFETVRKADATLADADFGYFDENQDGKITRKEFVEKPSAFILRFDKTPAERLSCSLKHTERMRKQFTENRILISFQQRGHNDHSGTDSLHGVRIRNCSRSAGSLKALQSGYGLHEIQPADLGAYQDLLLRLRRIGRGHHGTNI